MKPPRKPGDINRLFEIEVEPGDCGSAFRFENEAHFLSDAFTFDESVRLVSWRYKLHGAPQFLQAIAGDRKPH